MIRQSDIAPIQAGEAIGRALINQIADAANGARVMTGDETASVQMVGNVVGIGANFPAMNGDRDTLVRLRIRASSSPTPRLGPGLYYGSLYSQPTMVVKTDNADSTALTIEHPTPNFTTCVLLNLAESGQKNHAITAEMDVLARFVGWTVPTARGEALPILAFRENPAGDSVSFKITSDFDAGTYWGRYKAKSYKPKTGTSTSPGDLVDDEDLIVWNGAEYGLATSNNLLVSPNDTTFAVGPVSGTVIGTEEIGGVKYRIVHAWIGFASCEEPEPA